MCLPLLLMRWLLFWGIVATTLRQCFVHIIVSSSSSGRRQPRPHENNVDKNNDSNTKQQQQPQNRRLWLLLAWTVGAVAAYVSQLVLWYALWSKLARVVAFVATHVEEEATTLTSTNSNLTTDLWPVVWFSLQWSFWTCLLLGLCLAAFLQGLKRWCSDSSIVDVDCDWYQENPPVTMGDQQSNVHHTDSVEDQESNNTMTMTTTMTTTPLIVQLESLYVLGALLSITAVWITNDAFGPHAVLVHDTTTATTGTTTAATTTTTTAAALPLASWFAAAPTSEWDRISGLGAVVLLLVIGSFWVRGAVALYQQWNRRVAVRDQQGATHKPASTTHARAARFCLPLAGVAGATVGSASQALLCRLVLWYYYTNSNTTNGYVVPRAMDNDEATTTTSWPWVVLWSLLWSAGTVVVTAVGCAALEHVVAAATAVTEASTTTTTTTTHSQQYQRLLMRMEAVYIGCCLAGIGAMWVSIDVQYGMPEQVGPTLFLLAVALAAFAAILLAFPEDECLTMPVVSNGIDVEDSTNCSNSNSLLSELHGSTTRRTAATIVGPTLV